MTNSPALMQTPPQHRANFPAFGGNLAQPQATSRLGHFSSTEPVKQFLADGSDTDEAEFLPLYSASRRARRQKRRNSPAKSRPSLPFMQIDHFSHFGVSVAHNTGDRPE